MDGFRDRDRMNRGVDRGSSDRYDRYDRDRYSRGGRSSFSMGAPEGISADEVAGIVEDSNAKQLDVINDFFEDAKEDRLDSEKQIISAIDGISKDISAVIDEKLDEKLDKIDEKLADIKVDDKPAAAPIADDKIQEEILRTVNASNDLLENFAEEQLSMLVRGNSSTLNQISQTLEENDEILRQILSNTSSISNEISNLDTDAPAAAPSYMNSYAAEPTSYTNDNSDEILNTANNNGALLNALRSEVAALQQQLREMESSLQDNSRPQMDDNAPLDSEDTLTKSQADEMYKQLEEHVHSECVKVYRNFQKTLEDQNKAVIDGVGKGSGGARTFALLAFIVGLFNLIITFLTMYGIL